MPTSTFVDHRVKTAVSAVPHSKDAKLGDLAATYTAQVTCPPTCPMLGAGCYGESGPMGFTTHQRNGVATTSDASVMDVIRAEAAGIMRLSRVRGARDLRVHVVGDSPTDEAALVTSAAMAEYRQTTGKAAYTYTHGWQTVSRESWGEESVLASCESVAGAREAMARGYGAVVVVDHHESDKAYKDGDVTVIPCPNQTRGVKCADCRLCMNADKLLARKAVVAFAAHGAKASTVRATVKATK